jgi:hypothetical protein
MLAIAMSNRRALSPGMIPSNWTSWICTGVPSTRPMARPRSAFSPMTVLLSLA